MENKSVEMKFEGTKMIVNVDPNKDGGPVLVVMIDLMEIPDEVMSLVSSKKKA
jgi:hypothetical protein